MRVYVAGKFQDKELVRATQARLRAAGHTITHDWTFEDEGERTEEELREYLIKCAQDDADGVADAEAIVVHPHPNGQGLYVELGIALALEKYIFIVGELTNCIFLRLEECVRVDDLDMLCTVIDDIETKPRAPFVPVVVPTVAQETFSP